MFCWGTLHPSPLPFSANYRITQIVRFQIVKLVLAIQNANLCDLIFLFCISEHARTSAVNARRPKTWDRKLCPISGVPCQYLDYLKDERRRDLRDRQGRSSAATSRSECLNRRRRFNMFSDGRLRGRQPWTRRQGCPGPRSNMAPRVPNGSGVTPRTQSSMRSASS